MWDIRKYRHSRFWAVREGGPDGKLVCLCVYRKGAQEVVRRLGGPEAETEMALPKALDSSDRLKGAVT